MHPLPRSRSMFVVAFVFGCFAFGVSHRSFAACPVYDELNKAMAAQQSVVDSTAKDVLSPATQKKLIDLLGPSVMESQDADVFDVMTRLAGKLEPAEAAELLSWITARTARDAADEAVKTAQQAFYDDYLRHAEALKQAEADYAKEVEYLKAERAAIESMPHDGDAYLDRVDKLVQRLQGAYEKMKRDLAPYEACWGDVRTFIADKDKRLLKLSALEGEIARRRARAKDGNIVTAADGTTTIIDARKPAEPAEAVVDKDAPGPPGEMWVLTGPKIEGGGGNITQADATGFTISVPQDDGTKAEARVNFTKVPPAHIRSNEKVELQLSAQGDKRAYIHGNIWADNCVGKQGDWDNGCSNQPGFKSAGAPGAANGSFWFGPNMEPATVMYYGGQYNAAQVKIVWTYKREGGN